MNVAYLNTPDFSFFCDSTKQINHRITHLQSAHCRDNEHGDIEQYIVSLRQHRSTSIL